MHRLRSQPVHSTGGTNVHVDLHAVPLHAIHGHVYIDRNGNGEFDAGEGVPIVVMLLSRDGVATMSDEEGAYGFYNLLPDRYQVRVDADRLRRDLIYASPDPIDLELDEAGRARTGVDFRVMPRQKPIVMQKSFPQ